MTGLNTQRKVVRREQDSRETERERDRVLLQIGGGVGNKFGRLDKIFTMDIEE
jgi:hypothetical protein